jgi:hypothetical protein
MAEQQQRRPPARRTFLFGLLTGAGAVGAVAAVGRAPRPETPAAAATAAGPEPILYRRTEHVEAYYRTLYT